MPNSLDSHGRSSAASFTINPFSLTDLHDQHINCVDILQLENDDRSFCPKCFDDIVLVEIGNIEESTFKSYVLNLFEALDQHGDRKHLKSIVLPILGILMKHKKLVLSRDDHYHSLTKIIYKLIRNKTFNLGEFTHFVAIISGLSIETIKPIPLKSVWTIWSHLLDYCKPFTPVYRQDGGYTEDETSFFRNSFQIIRSYLHLVNTHVDNQVSDQIFAIMIRDTQDVLSQQYYCDSQQKCLDILRHTLVPRCSYYFVNSDQLNESELSLLGAIFEALKESLETVLRISDSEYNEWLRAQDFILRIHSIFYRERNIVCRRQIEDFLREYVLHTLEREYGSDPYFKRYLLFDSDVQTVRQSRNSECYDHKFATYGFYILLNCTAIKLNSNYFVLARVRDALDDRTDMMDEIRKSFNSSITMMRAFAFVTAVCLRCSQLSVSENAAKQFLKKIWVDMWKGHGRERFRHIFCYDEIVLEWSYKNRYFARLFDLKSLRYCIKRSSERGYLASCLKILLTGSYRNLIITQIRFNHAKIINKLIELTPDPIVNDLLLNFANLLSAMLHESILRALNERNNSECLDHAYHEMSSTILLLGAFNKFNPSFDERFLIDLTRFIEMLYQTRSIYMNKRYIVITSNELISTLIRCNHPCVNKLVQHLDFTLLGYMYSSLNNKLTSQDLIESVAQVLIAYDSIDYPFRHRIDRSLYIMLDSVIDWTVSRNRNLHLLAMILFKKIYIEQRMITNDLAVTKKNSLITGFIHMLFNDHDLITDNLDSVLKILGLEEFRFNPLCKQLLYRIPTLKEYLDSGFYSDSLPVSPDLSFESVCDEFDDNISITNILDHLSEETSIKERLKPTPRNIHLCRSMSSDHTIHSSVDTDFPRTDEMERRAYQVSQSSKKSLESEV